MTDQTSKVGRPVDLTKLNPPETAPKDGSQFVAWAIDEHGNGFRQPAEYPRWVIAQWAGDLHEDPYWRWSVPGWSTRVRILGWLPLGWNDHWGNYDIGIYPDEVPA